jgi:hypothetical protein
MKEILIRTPSTERTMTEFCLLGMIWAAGEKAWTNYFYVTVFFSSLIQANKYPNHWIDNHFIKSSGRADTELSFPACPTRDAGGFFRHATCRACRKKI